MAAKEHIINSIHEISGLGALFDEKDIDVDDVLRNFNPTVRSEKYNTCKTIKAASLILLSIAVISISGVTYAALSKRLSGVHKSTPQLEERLDSPNPVQEVLESLPETMMPTPSDAYSNTQILTPSSFEFPEIYNVITDVALKCIDDHTYVTSDFIFDQYDIAVFTKNNGNAWQMKKNQTLQIGISIDSDFAACESSGEDIRLAYIINGKFNILGLEKIADELKSVTFTAPEDGEYYLAIVNASFSYIKVTHLEIKRDRESAMK